MTPVMKCKLEQIAKKRGLSLRKIATDIGLSDTSYESLRRIAKNIASSFNAEIIGKVCVYLQVTPGELFEVEGVSVPKVEKEVNIPYELHHYLDLGLIQQCNFLRSSVVDYPRQSHDVKFVFDREYERLRKAMQHSTDPSLKESFEELTTIYLTQKGGT
ncbi:helix-turn-helix transcriptional regulator [Thermoactinomyces sp. DSM 45892]|uniref:helix-turn-helix domain-containing protein n=1 Tax=Thermoactinomyces sp. DSM 45892 TaxID=1882753 RepID=UPI00089B9FA9|nr:helix-turn-helix transcriptional regulator [Thermoactinomyces sp. DSM 45892]SDY83508.1 Cro/C1-type HTH DNA-binding domain-containing protein [Thermoactinomyces sp. DSM 45892]